MKHLLNLNLGVILARHLQIQVPALTGRIKRTHKRSPATLFLCLSVFGRLCGGASARRFSFDGPVSSVQSASLLSDSNGGSSQLFKRGLHHA
jgi:hypothetical protein